MRFEVEGQAVDLDNEGFLLDPSQWNRAVAERLAEGESLELNEQRWEVVDFVREYLETRQTVPEARVVLKALAERKGKDQATRRYLYQLFPYGYGQQACKIAGMRKPLKLMLDV